MCVSSRIFLNETSWALVSGHDFWKCFTFPEQRFLRWHVVEKYPTWNAHLLYHHNEMNLIYYYYQHVTNIDRVGVIHELSFFQTSTLKMHYAMNPLGMIEKFVLSQNQSFRNKKMYNTQIWTKISMNISQRYVFSKIVVWSL